MSHLISTYAAATGLRIARPEVLSNFIAVPHTRYITIQTGSGQGAKNYDYWQEVIVMIGPKLAAREIGIVHLGSKDDPSLQGVYDMRGKTTVSQANYLIQNCLLHAGNDSWLAHCAGWNNKPLVALYGNTHPAQHGPYWYNKDKTILLQSHRCGGVPTYSSQENPKTVNFIPPEDVCNAILGLLEIPEQIPIQSRLIGLLYSHVLFDVVPNSFPAPSFMPDTPVSVRMDLLHNEGVLINLLKTGRKVNILTKQPIDLTLLNQFKASILSYTHEIDETCPLQYAGMLSGIIRHSSFFTKERDEAKIAALRFQFFDICNIQQANDVNRDDYLASAQTYTNKKGDEGRAFLEKEIQDGTLRFKSNHYFLSEGKIYLSTAHLKADKPVTDFGVNEGTMIDSPDWFRDLNHFFVYNQPTQS